MHNFSSNKQVDLIDWAWFNVPANTV